MDVFKPTLRDAAITPSSDGGSARKEVRLVYADGSGRTRSEPTPADERARFCLVGRRGADPRAVGRLIEQHYSARAGHPQPMDIEWAKDGATGELVHPAGAAGDGPLAEAHAPALPRSTA